MEAARPRRAGRPARPVAGRRVRPGGAGDRRDRPGRAAGRSPPGGSRGGTPARGDRPRRPGPDRGHGGGVWATSRGHLADGLEREIAADPQSITVVVAEAGRPWSAPAGCATSPAPASRRCGAARRWRVCAAGASTVRWSATGRGWPPSDQHPAPGGRLRRQPADPGAARPRPGHHHHALHLHSVTMGQRLTDDERLTLKTGAFGAVFLVSNADPGMLALLRRASPRPGCWRRRAAR